jgi:hypothetical protein
MSRPISQSFRTAVQATNSGEVALLFATISHPDWVNDFRFVSDTVDYVWNGDTYIGAMFDVELITDTDQLPTAKFTFPNVDRSIGELIQTTTSPPTIRLDISLSAYFDLSVTPRLALGGIEPTPEYTAQNLWIADVTVDAIQVSGRIVGIDLTVEGCTRFRCTKDRAPALFR